MFTSFASRCACATLLAATLLAGCTDELKYRKGDPANGSIGFNARLMSGWVNTRAEQCDRPYVSDVKGGEAIADSLFLNMTTTPGVMTGTYDLRHAEGLEYDTDRKGEGIVTRATPVTPDNGEMYTDFGVSAYSYQGDWDEATATPDFFYNLKASRQTNGIYNLADSYFWPAQGYNMRFFAMAPYNNAYFTMSDASKKGSPTITVDIPGNVGYQKDLLVATSGEMTNRPNENVDLNFQHPLTAIRFVVGDDMVAGVVQKINIHNVLCQGELNLANNQWIQGSQKRTYYQTIGKTVQDAGNGNASQNTEITNASQTFMMMPQTLPDDAMISMEITVGGKLYTVSAPIAGQVWQPGTTVTYQLSTSSIGWTYSLNVTATEPITSLTSRLRIESYRTHSTGRKETIPYTFEYSEDNCKTWSKNAPSCLEQIIAPTTVTTVDDWNFQFKDLQSIESDLEVLRSNPEVGTVENPYNLSNSTGEETVENTANCYVIKAAGKYRIPLVYGNGIKNGLPNPDSYNGPAVDNTYILKKFINHLGNAISDPYIYNNTGCTPGGCKIVYSHNYAVENLHLDETKQYLDFDVNKNRIWSGNTIISVTDASGNTMWSWQIWITPKDVNKTIPIQNSNSGLTHYVMNQSLGQTGYNGNQLIWVKVSNKNASKIVDLTLPTTNSSRCPSGLLYNFGNKMPVCIVTKGTSRSSTNAISQYTTIAMSNGTTYLKNTCLYPNGSQQQNHTLYINLWDNSLTGYASSWTPGQRTTKIKTIYDPSPVGFCVISESAMSVLATGTKYSSKDQWGFYQILPDGTKIWSLELGFFRYSGSLTSSYGNGCYIMGNTAVSSTQVYEIYGGTFYYCYFRLHTRGSYCGDMVLCQTEDDREL